MTGAATWKHVKLGEVGQSLIGLTYSPNSVKRSGTLVLRSSNIQDGRLAFEDNVYVDSAIPDKIRIRENDILICVRNGSRRLIGKSVILDHRVVGQTFGAFMAVFRSAANPFLRYFFQSDDFKRQIDEHLGATINQITNASLNSFVVALPPEPEQRAIVLRLQDADNLIETLERHIAKKQAIKQGVMQQLLTGRTRLPGFNDSWRRVSLGQLGMFLKGRGIKRDDVRPAGVPCIRYGELYTDFANYTRTARSFVSREVATTALPIRTGDLLFAGSGETRDEIGMCVAYVGESAAVAGGDIVVLRGSGFNAIFLAMLANLPVVANQKARAGQGDAVVHISSRALGDINVEVPSKAEQDAIADVLIDVDRELDALAGRLQKARAVKIGMMQQLLTGRVRLPVEVVA
jgi:type I restriction enzyme S subunit